MSNEKFLLAVILPILVVIIVGAAGISVYFGVFFDKNEQTSVVVPDVPDNPVPASTDEEYYFEYSDEMINASMKMVPIDNENGLQVGWRIEEIYVPNNIVSDNAKKIEMTSVVDRGNLGNFVEIPIAFPRMYQNLPILEIGNVFLNMSVENRAKISLVHIPDTVLVLDGTFENFVSLSSLSFDAGNNVEELGAKTFKNCISVKKIQFPKLLRAGDSAFEDCTELESFVVGEDFESVGSYCFFNCAKITNSEVFSFVSDFGDFCFSQTGFTKFSFGTKLASVGMFLFFDCQNLSLITFDGETDWTKASKGLSTFALPNKNVEIDVLGWNKTQTSKALAVLKQQCYSQKYDVKIQTGSITVANNFKSLTYLQ